MEPSGRTYIVSGASSGIGAALALALLRTGAHVTLAARREAALAEVLARAPSPERALVVPTDVTDHDALFRLVRATRERFGALHGVVHCAGAGHLGRLDTHEPAQIEAIVRLNLLAPLWLTRLALPALRAAETAQVVCISSMASLTPLPYQTPYVATKAGLDGMAAALRRELLDTHIGVVSVHPAVVDTPMVAHLRGPMSRAGIPLHAYDADWAAARIVAGMRRGRRRVIVGGITERALAWLDARAPRAVDLAMRALLPRTQQLLAELEEEAALSRR